MPTVIRCAESSRGPEQIAFNFDDMIAQANRYLDQVRAEAAKIVLKAKQDAEAVRKEAEREGQQLAVQAAECMIQRQLASVLPALQQAAQEIQHAKQAWLRHWEAGAVHVATAIARRLVRRELEQHPEITLTLVHEALELAAGSSQLRIHLHPDDYKALGGQVEMLTKELAGLAETQLVADAEIARGGCRIDTRFGTIDQQLDAQLERIAEELTQ
jgi:flagellar assembly protein FliH